MTAPKSLRLHIGIFGRRNAGKSSLLNALTRQEVSIVSDLPGTTTDPVEKPMELLPLGPVLFIDTAGADDDSALGEKRTAKTAQCLDRTDLGLVVTDGAITRFEEQILDELDLRKVPALLVFNKSDLPSPPPALLNEWRSKGRTVLTVSARTGEGLDALRETLIAAASESYLSPQEILSDLVGPGRTAILVIPIDKEAPKGRIILPQVQAIRDLLDHDACAVVVKENGLSAALSNLKEPPALVVTDSQAFAQVAAVVPESIPLTGFSVLFSRFKGDLLTQALGAMAVDRLKDGDRVLIAEACTHHPTGDDIGRIKIPAWLEKRRKGRLSFTVRQGHDFPDDLSSYQLAILCGSCMQNRREVFNRLLRCQNAHVPVTNYGLAIAYSLGIFERALSPFPAVLAACRRAAHA